MEGEAAKPTLVTSGVPQGTVLGPLLFLSYINDLPNTLNSSVRLFADDTLLYGLISGSSTSDELQADLSKLEAWQEKWQMKFNPGKCKVLCVSTTKDPPQRKYSFSNTELEQVESVAYLGITLNNKMKLSEHVSNTASKASKLLGMARRNFWNCPKHVRETVYKTMVRPKLEYACEAWDPHYKKESPKKRHQILLAELCSTCQCYGYVGHAWREYIGREEGGIKINNDVQDKS